MIQNHLLPQSSKIITVRWKNLEGEDICMMSSFSLIISCIEFLVKDAAADLFVYHTPAVNARQHHVSRHHHKWPGRPGKKINQFLLHLSPFFFVFSVVYFYFFILYYSTVYSLLHNCQKNLKRGFILTGCCAGKSWHQSDKNVIKS